MMTFAQLLSLNGVSSDVEISGALFGLVSIGNFSFYIECVIGLFHRFFMMRTVFGAHCELQNLELCG
ncbi:hypothetical protein [Secundilactobacillus collinoides]|uniref:hypothetical protein n=1 Tax=Secundilactobacillus collinoides TaxID=33960 RepID=UPI0006CF4EA5|nr:hypothetical protein [Secundilactobacillus collinoides]